MTKKEEDRDTIIQQAFEDGINKIPSLCSIRLKFGKFEGESLLYLMLHEKDYINYLCAQPSFKEEYTELYNIILNPKKEIKSFPSQTNLNYKKKKKKINP